MHGLLTASYLIFFPLRSKALNHCLQKFKMYFSLIQVVTFQLILWTLCSLLTHFQLVYLQSNSTLCRDSCSQTRDSGSWARRQYGPPFPPFCILPFFVFLFHLYYHCLCHFQLLYYVQLCQILQKILQNETARKATIVEYNTSDSKFHAFEKICLLWTVLLEGKRTVLTSQKVHHYHTIYTPRM